VELLAAEGHGQTCTCFRQHCSGQQPFILSGSTRHTNRGDQGYYLTELSNFALIISKRLPIVGGPLPEQWKILNELEQSVSFTVVLLDSSASGLVQRTAEGVLHLYLTPYMFIGKVVFICL